MKRYTNFIKAHWFEMALITLGVMLVIWQANQYADALNELNNLKGIK